MHLSISQPAPRMHAPLFVPTVAFAAGVLADRFGVMGLEPSLLDWWIVSFTFLFCSFALWFWQFPRAFTFTLFLAIAGAAASWHQLHWDYVAQDELALFAGKDPEPVCVEAKVVSPPRLSPEPEFNPLRAIPPSPSSDVELEILRLRDGENWQAASGTCNLRIYETLENLSVGDRVQVFAKFRRPEPAMNPGDFSWEEHERAQAHFVSLATKAVECVSVVKMAALDPLQSVLDRIRDHCVTEIDSYVGEEQSDLAMAVMLGAREELQDMTYETFLDTGTVHLLVVSGLHVGILALVVWGFVGTGIMPQRWGLLATALVVITYAVITGGRPPVMRAMVLVLLGLGAFTVGRRISWVNFLSAAALVVMVINPAELFRAGTQLSFLCVAALGGFGVLISRQIVNPLERMIQAYESWPEKIMRTLRSRFVQMTFASALIWLVTAPLVAHSFHRSAPVSIAITPLIWPLVAGALGSGLVLCTLGWLLPPLATLLGTFCSLCLSTTESIVQAAAQFDVGSFHLGGPPAWWLVVFYVGLCFVSSFGWQKILACASLWMATGFVIAAPQTNSDELRCTFLSMGHGTCVVLKLPENQTILYDAGSLASPHGATQSIANYLWSRGISHIDAVVLSHADVDHYNALPGLLERFDVGVVYVSPLMFDPWALDGQLTAPEYLREKLSESKVPLKEIWINDRLTVAHPGVAIEVMHPPETGVAGRDNANSLVLQVKFAGHSILLPGDLEGEGLEALTAEEPIKTDILLAPHHGSGNSDPPGFAAWCTPRWTVISGQSRGQDLRLAENSYQKVGSAVLQTSELGAIQFTLGQAAVEVCSYMD